MYKKLAITTAMIVIFFFSYAAYYYRAPIYNELSDLKLIPETDHFTELYFENYTALPAKITAGQPMEFSFTINNLEGKDMAYLYRVYFNSSDGRALLMDQKTVNIKNGEYSTVKESYIFNQVPDTGIIKVELDRLNQEVHFLLANK